MKDSILQKQNEVIDQTEIWEYYVSMLSIYNKSEISQHALKCMKEILKDELVLNNDKPLRWFYCIVFYLNNGFQHLNLMVHRFWNSRLSPHKIPTLIEKPHNQHMSISYKIGDEPLQNDIYISGNIETEYAAHQK